MRPAVEFMGPTHCGVPGSGIIATSVLVGGEPLDGSGEPVDVYDDVAVVAVSSSWESFIDAAVVVVDVDEVANDVDNDSAVVGRNTTLLTSCCMVE